MRARIVKESEEAMAARFGGPQGVYLPRTQQELTAVMKEMNAGAGETIVRILEQARDPGAILRFGAEEDLVKILQDPVDVDGVRLRRVHGDARASALLRIVSAAARAATCASRRSCRGSRRSGNRRGCRPATIGMSDRGLIALGMAADIVVFDPNTIIDRATYENPALPSEGVRHVLVNGVVALKDGVATERARRPGAAAIGEHAEPAGHRPRALA